MPKSTNKEKCIFCGEEIDPELFGDKALHVDDDDIVGPAHLDCYERSLENDET